MGTSAEELLLRISGDASSGNQAVKEFEDHVTSMGHGFVARVAEGVLLRDAIHELVDVVKEGVMAFPELVEHTIATGNSLFEMSLKTGGSVENLSQLRYVASQTGIDFESFGNILFKMQQALGATGAKADEMQKHLDVLGLNLQTLKNEKPDQAFIDIMSALEDIPNRADQAAAGMAIFGKGFKEMAGLTQESITDLMDEAKDLGLTMSTETAAAAHAAEVGFKGFSMQLEAVGMEVASTVLPALVALTKLVSGEFHSAVEAAGHPVIDLKQTVEDVIMKMLDWATVGIDTAQFLDHAFEGTKAVFFAVEGYVMDLASAFLHFVEVGASVSSHIPGLGALYGDLGNSVKDARTWVDGFADGLHKESDGALDAAAKHDVMFKGLTAGIGDMKAHFGEAFDKAGEEIGHFAETSKNAFGGLGADVEGGKGKVDKFGDAMKDLASAGTSWRATLEGMDGAVVEAAEAYVRAGVGASTLKEVYGLTETQIKALESAVKSQTEAQKIFDTARAASARSSLKWISDELEAEVHYADQVEKLTIAQLETRERLRRTATEVEQQQTLSRYNFERTQIDRWVADQTKTLNTNVDGWEQALDDIDEIAQAKYRAVAKAESDAFKQMREQEFTWENEFANTLERLPQLLSGGGFGKMLGSLGTNVGGDLGKSLQQSLWTEMGTSEDGGNMLTHAFGDRIGGALTNALPGIGAMIGPAVTKLWSLIANIGGPSQQELDGRKVEGAFEKSFGGFQQMMDAVGKAYADTGRGAQQAQADVKALMDAEKNGAAATQSMIDKINGAFADEKTKAASVSFAVSNILATAKTVGGDFPEAMKPLVEQLAMLPGLTDDEKDSLLRLTGVVKPSFADLTRTAKEYGLGLTDLGPAFEQADITGRADKILTDFGALTKAGADAGGVLHGMGKSVNDLVNDAIKYGSALPTALKPLVQNLFDTGQLTDAAGKKLDSIGDIKFDDAGDPLAKGMSSLTDALNRLGDILSPTSKDGLAAKATATAAQIAAAMGGIPDKHVNIIYDRAGAGDGEFAIPMAAGGIGRVSRPTLFLAGEAGAEDVAFSGGGKSFKNGIPGQGGAGVTVNVTVEGNVSTERDLANAIFDQLSDKVRSVSQLSLRRSS